MRASRYARTRRSAFREGHLLGLCSRPTCSMNSTQSTVPVLGGCSNKLHRLSRQSASHCRQSSGTCGCSLTAASSPPEAAVSLWSSASSDCVGSTRPSGDSVHATRATASRRLSSCSMVHRNGCSASRGGRMTGGTGTCSRTFGCRCRCATSRVRRAEMRPSLSMCSLMISTNPATASSSFCRRSSTQSRNWAKASAAAALTPRRRRSAQARSTKTRCVYVTRSATSACCRSMKSGGVGPSGCWMSSSATALPPFLSGICGDARPFAFALGFSGSLSTLSATGGAAYSAGFHTAACACVTRSSRKGNSQRPTAPPTLPSASGVGST
mmetsp:Transcript_1032/g.2944  ORF Transcript_1032/g.2944 Transcript_1032/m.2944 type:complete len:326 (-) Transcript_1032:881-1858(-)